MQELKASNGYLGKPDELRRAVETDGYLYLRDVVDRDVVSQAKHGVMAWFAAQKIVDVIDDEPICIGDPGLVGDYPQGLYDTRLAEWFAMRPEQRRLYADVFGEDGYVLPIAEYQFTWPGRETTWGPHQDGPFFNDREGPFGTGLEFLVFWFPLMSINEAVGGLSIVPTPRSTGSLHGPMQETASRFIAPDVIPEDAWHRADYQPGDVLIFGPFTPHRTIPNTSDRLRLSIDLRVQPASAPRLITGVVIGTESDGLVIAADSGGERCLAVDERTSLRLPSSVEGRNRLEGFLGRRVIVTAREGLALVVRNTHGYVPWEQ